MNKKLTTGERRKLITDFLNSGIGREFLAWWKNHRHSGYATRGTQERWGIDPYKASRCDHYLAEFCSDSGYQERLRFDYSAEDYERWAREQKEADESVTAFAAAHGGRKIPTSDEFQHELQKSLLVLRKKFAMQKEPGYSSLTEEQIHEQLNAHMRTFPA